MTLTRKQFKQAFDDNFNSSTKVALVSHLGPDDDAVGSLLSMRAILVEQYGFVESDVTCFVEGSVGHRWENFPNVEKIVSVQDLSDSLNSFPNVIFLDANELSRFSEHEIDVDATTWCIDHHPSDDLIFDFSLVDDSPKATCQIIGEVFLDESSVSKNIGEPMLMGILGDTGNFRYVDEKSSDVFLVAEKLVRGAQIDVQKLQSIYSVTKADEFVLYSKLMGNSTILEVAENPAFMYSLLTEQDVAGFSDEMISGAAHMFVSWTTRIQGVGWGFVLTPRSTGRVAISLRSIPGSVSVRGVAEGMEIGGGHVHASGGRFDDCTTADALKQIINYLGENKVEIVN